MNQTKLETIVESSLNTVLGYGIAVGCQLIIFPWWNIHIPLSGNMAITAILTVVSFIRVYTLRRSFNAGLHKRFVQFITRLITKVLSRTSTL